MEKYGIHYPKNEDMAYRITEEEMESIRTAFGEKPGKDTGRGMRRDHMFPVPPYTLEKNRVEQVWREMRTRGYKNEVFHMLEDVIDRLCKTICS